MVGKHLKTYWATFKLFIGLLSFPGFFSFCLILFEENWQFNRGSSYVVPTICLFFFVIVNNNY